MSDRDTALRGLLKELREKRACADGWMKVEDGVSLARWESSWEELDWILKDLEAILGEDSKQFSRNSETLKQYQALLKEAGREIRLGLLETMNQEELEALAVHADAVQEGMVFQLESGSFATTMQEALRVVQDKRTEEEKLRELLEQVRNDSNSYRLFPSDSEWMKNVMEIPRPPLELEIDQEVKRDIYQVNQLYRPSITTSPASTLIHNPALDSIYIPPGEDDS